MLLIYVYESILRPCISTLYYTPILQVVSKMLLWKMNQLIAKNLLRIWFFKVFSAVIAYSFFNSWMSLVAFDDIQNRIMQWFFCSQIEEIHIKWAFICLTMGSQWLIHWWWALASVLDCCYDRGRKNRFEAALRPLCAFWRGAWYSDRNLLSILNSEFALHTGCTYLLRKAM